MSDTSVPETYDDGTDSYTTDSYPTDGYDSSTGIDAGTTMQVDMDQDGIAETTIIDFDGDGIGDAFDSVDPNTGAEMLALDADGDGKLDTVVQDADGDGVFESGSQDTDGDGKLDTAFDPNTGATTSTDGPFAPFDDGSTDPTDPTDDGTTDDGADDTVHGDPMAEIPYHQAQAGSNDCLPTSVAMVLSEATGSEVDASDVVDVANELGLLGESGMSMEGGLALLDHWGVDAEVQTGSIDQLRTMLDADTPVIIGLDADDLYGAGDAPFADDLVSGHAVVITGIDDEAGLVYINDPGFPDGAGVAISIEAFEDAWQDADHTMIVAEADATATDTTDTSSDSSSDSTNLADALSSAGSAGSAGTDQVETIGNLHGDETIVDRIASLVLLPFNLSLR